MRCVVIGSGITGMTAALLLARQGHGVTLIEACDHAAPLLRGFERNELRFDTGFHCGGGVHREGILRRWLRVLGVEASLEGITTSHSDVFMFSDGKEYRLPSGLRPVVAASERQFPGSGKPMENFLLLISQELASSPYLNPDIHSEPKGILADAGCLNDYLDKAGFPPHLRAMLSSRCLLYGVPPSLASWRDYTLVAGPYFQSCGSWHGGGAALVDALMHALQEAGVTLQLGCAVNAIEADTIEGVHSVVLKDGTRMLCERCFFTGHPSQLQSLLSHGLLRPAYLHHIADLPETNAALLLFAETYDALRDDESLFLLPSPYEMTTSDTEISWAAIMAKSSIYVYCGRPAADGRKPVMAVLFIPSANLPEGNPQPRPSSYVAWKRQAVESLRLAIEYRVPGLRGAWRIIDAATPLTMRHWIYGSTGSLYGVSHQRTSMPLFPSTRVPGLFLAGQNVLLPGVLGGIVSAAVAVGFAFGHNTVLKEFRACTAKE